MAHFAEINEENKVIRVLVVPNDQEHRGNEYLSNDLGLGGTWLKTSYNARGGVHLKNELSFKKDFVPFRKNFAAIGSTYDSARDAFIDPRPGPSWVLNEETCLWEDPNKESE